MKILIFYSTQYLLLLVFGRNYIFWPSVFSEQYSKTQTALVKWCFQCRAENKAPGIQF